MIVNMIHRKNTNFFYRMRMRSMENGGGKFGKVASPEHKNNAPCRPCFSWYLQGAFTIYFILRKSGFFYSLSSVQSSGAVSRPQGTI